MFHVLFFNTQFVKKEISLCMTGGIAWSFMTRSYFLCVATSIAARNVINSFVGCTYILSLLIIEEGCFRSFSLFKF